MVAWQQPARSDAKPTQHLAWQACSSATGAVSACAQGPFVQETEALRIRKACEVALGNTMPSRRMTAVSFLNAKSYQSALGTKTAIVAGCQTVRKPGTNVRAGSQVQQIVATYPFRIGCGATGMKRKYCRAGFTAARKAALWERWRQGGSLKTIGCEFGKPPQWRCQYWKTFKPSYL